MSLRRFLDEREPAWTELDGLLARAGRRPEVLGADGVRRLAALYRGAAADLAQARVRFPGDPVVRRLEALVGSSRALVYGAPPRPARLAGLRGLGYFRLIGDRPWPLVAATLLLFVPLALAAVWAYRDPGAAGGVVPQGFASIVEPRPDGTDLGFGLDENAAFAAEIFTNNIRVAVLAFAGGMLLGLGTVGVLVSNGLLFGVIGGLGWGAGNGASLVALVAPHGFLELTCIVVAGATGLRVGWAIVHAGLGPRGPALRAEALASVQIVVGTAFWLVVAGLVEGFVTPRGLAPASAVAVGLAVAAPFWALLAVALVRRRGFRQIGDAEHFRIPTA